jgi:hypothetical protein
VCPRDSLRVDQVPDKLLCFDWTGTRTTAMLPLCWLQRAGAT